MKRQRPEAAERLGLLPFLYHPHFLKRCTQMHTNAAKMMEFTEDDAKAWTARMKNADGTTGPHWTMEQTTAVAESMGIQASVVPRWAWGVTMNMMYSDYYDVAMEFGVNRPEFYAALAKAFLMDKDGPEPEEKLCAYYKHIASRG